MNFKYFILELIILSLTDASKLNLPRVLLPIFKSFSSNYTLEVTGFGCYKWSSSRVDVVEVRQLDEHLSKGCSQRAVVSSVGRLSARTMAIVLAEEVSTGQVFRADVIVDVISSLNVVTTTRELYMEEPPEMFEIRAYDAEGNEFTTLEGVQLEWTLVKEKSGQDVIRFISFRESTYETPSSIAAFDVVGKQGHIVLLEGIRTGTSKVVVRLPHTEYSSVGPVEVTISVIANLIIDPSDVYILQGDKVNFRILQVRQGRLIELKRSFSPQYILTPEDNTIVQIEDQVATGLYLGRSKILLRDLNSNMGSEQQKLPQAFVNVVEPSYISLSIDPHNNWALFTEQPATLVTEVFDVKSHKVTLGEGTRIEMSLDESVFPLAWRSANGSWADGKAVLAGVTEVKAQLYEAGPRAETKRPLMKTSATLHVFPPLTLHPPVVAFPFHHITWNEVEMRVEGGDGINLWSTHNHSVAVVNQAGILKPIGEGETKVNVAMVRNEHLKASSSVLVLKPHTMEILGGVHETQVGSHIHLDIALYGLTKHGVRVPFTDCSQMTFSVSVDSSFQYDREIRKDPSGDACAVVSLLANKDSKSRVVISLINGLIEAETLVAAFKPLFPLHPPHSKPVVLTVRSSRHIVFGGGPKPWFGKVVSAYSSNPSLLQATVHHESQELFVYNIVCNKIGTTEFTLTSTTEPYVSNVAPVKSQASVTVICAKPKHLELSANMGPDCPISDLDRALATKNSKIKVKVIVRDGEGRKFDNATSLLYKWFLGKDDLFAVEEPESIDLLKESHADYVLPVDHYKELTSKNTAASTTIKLKAVGYAHDKLSIDIRAEGAISVNIVDSLLAEPNSLSVINQAGSQSVVKLHHGSGYFSVDPSPDNVVSVEFDTSQRRVMLIKPVLDGKTNLKITDKCVRSSSVVLPVQVLNVGAVRIEVTPRMEVNRHTTAVVKLYDTLDRELSGDVEEIGLEATAAGVVSTARSDPKNPRVFLVKALEVGRTSLIATFNNISSPSAQIQVFTAIKLFPRNITLLVGSEYQVRVTGGPGPDLQFTMSDQSVATISNTGLITGHHVGESWVSVSTLGGEGRDSIAVSVIPLVGVQVGGPTTVLCVGGRAPLWAQPLPESLSPLALASVNPSFTYTWTSSLPGVAHIVDRYAQVNIHVKDEDRLSVEVRGDKPGRTVIHLRLTGGSTEHGVYESSLELLIVEELAFTLPPTAVPSIIVAPNIKFNIRTNLENAKFSVSSVVGDQINREETDAALMFAQSPVLSLSRDGAAMSHSMGQALVTATASHPRHNVQTTALFVQVTSVHFMMVNVANVVNGSGLSSLPRGLDLLLNVSYHDCLGRMFYAAPAKVTLRSNRHDKTLKRQGSTNSSFVVGLEGQGVTVLHASDPISPVSNDYLKIPVENHIIPLRRQMVVGEVVCFESTLRRATHTHDAIWSCQGDSVSIETAGVARAVKPGTSVVTFRQPMPLANIQTAINIEVLPLYALSFGGGIALSNVEVGKEYIVGVKLLSRSGSKSRDAGIHPHLMGPCSSAHVVVSYPFTCQMRFNSLSVPHPINAIFTVMPTFDKSSGGFGCLVRVVSGISSNTSVIQSNVTLRVASWPDYHQDSSRDDAVQVTQDSVVLEFHPAVYVATPQLSLPTPSAVSSLVIVATPHVAQHIIVEAADRTVLRVGEVEKRGTVSWVWPVQLYRDHWSNHHRLVDLAVIVLSPLTNQTVKVPVVTPGGGVYKGCVYPEAGSWSLSESMPSPVTSFFVAIIAIIVFFMASNYCYNQMGRTQSSNPVQRYSPSHPTHASLQEYSQGGRTPSPLSHRHVVYGSHDHSPNDSSLLGSPASIPRMRRVYQ